MPQKSNVFIENFSKSARAAVRTISCDTAFHEASRKNILPDDEILADALTEYFTDYEPQGSFIAKDGDKVVGYITGAKNASVMDRVMGFKIIPSLLLKALRRGFFFKATTWRFIFYILRSLVKGEFLAPPPPKEMPAIMHINITDQYQHNGIGTKLINQYLDYLRAEKVSGVHLGTFSENAKKFFVKMGFTVLHQSKRTYLKPYLGKEVNYYLMGKKLDEKR